MTKDPKWRFRLKLLQNIPAISEGLSCREFKELFEEF